MPATKADAQKLLKRFGYSGLKIDEILPVEDIRLDGKVCRVGRIFALTRPMLHEDNTMRRQARTYLFHFVDDEVHVSEHEGWTIL